MLRYWIPLCLFSVFISGRIPSGVNGAPKQESSIGRACTSIENKPGRCVEKGNCETLQDKLKNETIVRSTSTEWLLKKSPCGWTNNEPHICCSDPVPETSNRMPTSTKSVKPEECGQGPKNREKIHGGRPAELGSWPWMVALGYGNQAGSAIRFACGASLISEEWLLTAAHCATNDLKLARLGDLDLDENVIDNAAPVDISIGEVHLHPLYPKDERNHDIALIRLSKTVKFSQLIQPVCLLSGAEFEKDEFYKCKEPVVVGWGHTKTGVSSTKLLEVSMPIVELDKCLQKYKSVEFRASFDENTLCTGIKGKDVCKGDSGGPLNFINPKDSRYYLGGIVSAGKDCDNDFPSIYMRVARFIRWINQVTELDF